MLKGCHWPSVDAIRRCWPDDVYAIRCHLPSVGAIRCHWPSVGAIKRCWPDDVCAIRCPLPEGVDTIRDHWSLARRYLCDKMLLVQS